MGINEKLANKAVAMGKAPADFHSAAQKHANTTWILLIVAGAVWYFVDWTWALVPAAIAAFAALKSVSSTMVASKLENLGPAPTSSDGNDDVQPPLDDDAISADVAQIETVVRDFGGLMEKIDPLSFYDVSVLPHPKNEILRALLVATRLSHDAHEREQLESALSFLACFQGDVGPQPISLMPVDVEALGKQMRSGEITDIEAAGEISKAAAGVDQEKYKRLQESYDEEVKRFLALARAGNE